MRVAEALATMRALPFGDLQTITGEGNVLILAPHADDESLGCGGLIAEACALGRPPMVLVLTDGTGSHPRSATWPPARLRAVRECEARNAVVALGLHTERLEFLALPDTAAPRAGPAFDRTAREIATWACATGCSVIASSWWHDPHCDHLAAYLLASAAAHMLRVRHIAYPVWGWLLPPEQAIKAGIAGFRLDIARHIPAKRRAIAAYRSQRGELITDDPSGFQMPASLLAMADNTYEVFLTLP